ncbi:unnamed protein product, partial [Brenthis ino]
MFCELPQFGRCCFCLPLRRGVLAFGYLNIVFSIFILVVCSLLVHNNVRVVLVYRGVTTIQAELCLTIYCVDTLFNVLLVYGAHKQIVSYLRYFYYYTLSTTIALVVIEILTMIDHYYNLSVYYQIATLTFFFTGLCIHLYLQFLVRSLMYRIDNSGCAHENQLHQFVNGELKVEGKCPSTVVPIENA